MADSTLDDEIEESLTDEDAVIDSVSISPTTKSISKAPLRDRVGALRELRKMEAANGGGVRRSRVRFIDG